MDPQLAALMSKNLRRQSENQSSEVILESSGGVKPGEKTKKKYKPPPGAQQLGMQAMLMQEASKSDFKLKKAAKK